MKIVHVLPTLDLSFGGPVEAVLGMSRIQEKMGHRVTIIATKDGASQSRDLESNSVDIRTYDCNVPAWHWSASMGRELKKKVAEADLVHIHTLWSYTTYLAAKLCKSQAVPFILRPCGMLTGWSLAQKKLKKRIYFFLLGQKIVRSAAAIQFTTKNELAHSSLIPDAVDKFVCPLGVFMPDSPSAKGQTESKKIAESGGCCTILFLGRLHHKKQPILLIRAFSELVKKRKNLKLVFAGTGDAAYEKKIRNLCRKLGLAECVKFVGGVYGERKYELLAAADVLVLPSQHENFGISIVEAMASRCPVIISKDLSLAEEIQDAQAGLLCDRTVASLSDCLGKMIDNPELRIKMGKNGEDLVCKRYTWEIVGKELMKHYQEVADKFRGIP